MSKIRGIHRWIILILAFTVGLAIVIFPQVWYKHEPWLLEAAVLRYPTPEGKPISYCIEENPIGSELSPGARICGKSFRPEWRWYLDHFNLSDEQTSRMSIEDDRRILSRPPVFVTSFSSNHFEEALQSLRTFSEMNPSDKVIVFDLGLTESQSQQEMLKQHEAVLYFDADVIWKSPNLTELLEKRYQNYYKSLMLGETHHSIYATTQKAIGRWYSGYSEPNPPNIEHDPLDLEMFDYLPMNLTAATQVQMGQAQFMLTYYTKDVRENLYKWLVLCALEQDCLAPKGATRFCKFAEGDRFNRYALCHRYDQSAFNILLANRNRFNERVYIVDFYHERS